MGGAIGEFLPYAVGVAGLKDIPVWGTVFEGEAFPLTTNAK